MGSANTTTLERLLSRSGAAGEPEIKAELSRLLHEIKTRRAAGSGASRDFFLSAVRALTRFRGNGHADARMACLFECGFYFFNSGDNARALAISHPLLALAMHVGDRPWMRKAHNFSGITNADLGNVGEAVHHYMEALRLARELRELDSEVFLFINLGVALMYGGLYRDAMPCLQRAVEQARAHSELAWLLPPALTNLAQVHLYTENFAAGRVAIAECLALPWKVDHADAAMSLAIRHLSHVQLSLGLGLIEEAQTHCRLCVENARASETLRGRILAGIASGLCDIYGGLPQRGLATLEGVLDICGASDWSRTDILVALVKGNDAAERPEEALHYLRQLLQHVRKVRESTAATFLGTSNLAGETSGDDLRALEIRELKLKVKTAERELLNSRLEMCERLAVTADLKEDASGEHGYRVGRLAALIAQDIGWPKEACYALDLAARLHDIGKIAMPDRILLTSEQLKEAERQLMSTHTLVGAELLAKSNLPQLQMAEEIARFHHEWWNGEGYPAKRREKRIPIHARIVALADVFDALTHGRPFAEPWPMDRALEEIRNRRGTQFDPELTDVFVELIAKLRKEHDDLDAYLGKAGASSPFLQARHKIRLMLAERDTERAPAAKAPETVH